VKIKIERSGGVTGTVSSNEISEEAMSSSMRNKVQRILHDEHFKSNTLLPKGAADFFNYKILFEDGTNSRVIECNQFTMKEDLKDIVRYIETHSKKN
jgi:hypothetical protein